MSNIYNFLYNVFMESLNLFLESAPYIVLGLIVSGFLKIFISTNFISKHLGHGKISSVIKAAIFGIPLPLCSCGVLPAALTLKKEGANKGSVISFLIATPVSGIDSISISYSLLDPILTIFRPLAAFIMAFTAGTIINYTEKNNGNLKTSDHKIVCEHCKTGVNNMNKKKDSEKTKEAFFSKIKKGILYSINHIWPDIHGWFFMGVIVAGFISVLVPESIFEKYLSGGIFSMIIMLFFGIPIYICATGSTPIAASLILKGVSPGTAMVFLFSGPATNIASLSVLLGIVGRKATMIYLGVIAFFSVILGYFVDNIYTFLNIDPKVSIGRMSDMLSIEVKIISAIILIILSFRILIKRFKS